MENQLDLTSLKLNDLKAIAAANDIEVSGIAKQPFIDAIATFNEENPDTLIIPEYILNPDDAPKNPANPNEGLSAGSFRYNKFRKVEDEWKPSGTVILTEGQAAALNSQTLNSGNKYEKI